MSPARRKRSRSGKKKDTNSSVFYRVFFFLFFVVLLFLVFRLTTKHFSSESKLSVTNPREDGSVIVSTFDPSQESIKTVIIPADTEVRVARQLGTWMIKSVWKLGEDEKLGGQLLAETITKQFSIPVFVWGDTGAGGFSSSSALQIIKAAVSPYKTNLGIGDRVRLAAFSLGVKNFKREEINLSNTRVLEKTTLVDGSEGHRVAGDIPSSIAAIYSDPHMSAISAKTQIKDATSNITVAKEVGKIIEVIGLKVASIENVDVQEGLDCFVSGRSEELTITMAKLFGCERKKHEEVNFDLTISIGEEFAKRF